MTFPFPFFSGGAITLAYTYDSAQFDGTNATTYTYNNQAIGSGDWLIIGTAYNSGGATGISSVTVNGNAASNISTGSNSMAFWRIAHPGGATANIVVTCSSSASRGVMGVWSMTGTPTSWTPQDTFTKGTDTTIDLYAGGVAFGIGYDGTAAADTWTAALFTDASAQLGGDSASGIVASNAPPSDQTGATCTVSAAAAYAISLKP